VCSQPWKVQIVVLVQKIYQQNLDFALERDVRGQMVEIGQGFGDLGGAGAMAVDVVPDFDAALRQADGQG
jgi:hypothetical protein